MFVNEPKRAHAERTHGSNFSEQEHKQLYSIKQAMKLLFFNRPYVVLCLASSVRMLSGYALGGWLSTYYERQFDLTSGQFGLPVGLIVIFGGVVGCMLGGLLSDALMTSTPAAKAYVIAATQIVAAPFIVAVFVASTPGQSYALLFFAYVTAETWLGSAAAIVQDITPASLRAFSTALYSTVNTLIGGLGPVVVSSLLGDDGLASRKYGETEGLKYTMIYLMPSCYILSAILFLLVGRLLALDLSKAIQ
jgi:MFS family permease